MENIEMCVKYASIWLFSSKVALICNEGRIQYSKVQNTNFQINWKWVLWFLVIVYRDLNCFTKSDLQRCNLFLCHTSSLVNCLRPLHYKPAKSHQGKWEIVGLCGASHKSLLRPSLLLNSYKIWLVVLAHWA